jgi:hypothetical protein
MNYYSRILSLQNGVKLFCTYCGLYDAIGTLPNYIFYVTYALLKVPSHQIRLGLKYNVWIGLGKYNDRRW